jgi:hypothetical protein
MNRQIIKHLKDKNYDINTCYGTIFAASKLLYIRIRFIDKEYKEELDRDWPSNGYELNSWEVDIAKRATFDRWANSSDISFNIRKNIFGSKISILKEKLEDSEQIIKRIPNKYFEKGISINI